MGFRWFFHYLSEKKLCTAVDIHAEVETWKRRNPDRTPILVVDFKSLAYCITSEKKEYICGGRHQVTLKCWENILKQLKRTGCKLVFFSDLNMSSQKMVTWMKRQGDLLKEYKKFYHSISPFENFGKILSKKQHLKPPNSTHHDMEIIAQNYGDFHYSVKCENDLELARYATDNDAFAIISNDFDFLIFDGSWKHWSSNGITEDSLQVTEYNRDGLLKALKLTRDEMPLFATVFGSDFAKKLFETADKAADFVRNKSSLKIIEIIKELPNPDKIDEKMFQRSLDAYDVSSEPLDNQEDPFERKLLNSKSKIYKFYMALMSPIQGISLLFYDMIEDDEPTINLPELIIKWTQRKIGILHYHKHKNGDTFKFTVATKINVNAPFAAIEKTPDYPDVKNCLVPPIGQLYSESQLQSVELIETKWDILKWIMSFDESEISTIRNVKKEFRLICAILCALVKYGLLNVKEADGILCTEYVIAVGIQDYVISPTNINARCIRAAHKYDIVFSYVRENFAIAGLLSCIEEIMKFDGVYFQQLMTSFISIKNSERHDRINPIKNSVLIDRKSQFNLF